MVNIMGYCLILTIKITLILFNLKRLQVQLPLSRRVLWSPSGFQHGHASLETSGVYKEPYFGIDWPSILRLRL